MYHQIYRIHWKQKFITTVIVLDDMILVVYIAFLTSFNLGLEIYYFYITSIICLEDNESSTFVFSKYDDFVDFFPKDLISNF